MADPLTVARALESGGIPRAAAEQITTEMFDAIRAARELDLAQLATKTDIAELRSEIAALGLRLIKWVIGVGLAAFLALTGVIWTATQILLHARL